MISTILPKNCSFICRRKEGFITDNCIHFSSRWCLCGPIVLLMLLLCAPESKEGIQRYSRGKWCRKHIEKSTQYFIFVSPINLLYRLALNYSFLPFPVVGDEITSVQSLQFQLGTIEAATNNFAEENKIGKGGFGDVYRVRS